MTKYREEISKEELKDFPIDRFKGKIVVIDKLEDVDWAINEMSKSALLGFDTETRPSFKKGRRYDVALLQLATNEMAFLFRLNHIGLPKKLALLLEDETIIKTGVAISDDLKALNLLTPFEPGGFIELQDRVKDFGIKSFGLKKISAIILGFAISKRQQVTNWENEILTDAQLVYAATDAWVCYRIYRKLSNSTVIKSENG